MPRPRLRPRPLTLTEPMRPFSSSAREHTLLAAIFVLLTLAHTFPMWLSPATVLNELGDVRLNTWSLAWGAHALVSAPLSIFDANTFHPHANSFAFSENILGTAVLVAPFNWAGYPALAYNVALLLAFALTGIATAYWVRELTGRIDAGIVAGIAWTFAPVRFDHLPHLQLLAAQWAPLALLALAAWVRTRRARHLIAAALLLAWQYAAGVQLTLLLMPLIVIVGLHLLMPHLRELATVRTAGQVAVAGALFVALTGPISLPYLEARDAEGFVRLLEETHQYSAQPVSLLSPSGFQRAGHMEALRHRYRRVESNFFPGILFLLLAAWGGTASLARARQDLLGRGAGELGPHGWPARIRSLALRGALVLTSIGLLDYLGTVLLAQWGGRPEWAETLLELLVSTHPTVLLFLGIGALVILWRPGPGMPAWAVWGSVLSAVAVLCFLLATGPRPTAWNSALGLGPFRLLYHLAMPYQSIRAVGRFGLTAVMALAVVAGIGFLRLAERFGAHGLRRAALVTIVVAAMFLEVRVLPFPTVDARVPDEALYERLDELPGRGAVVHVPITPGAFPAAVTEYMLGSTRHWRPLVNGYSGFLPPDLVQLGTLAPLDDPFFEVLRRDFAVEWVAVHGGYLEEFAALEPSLLARPDLELVDRWGETMLFRFRPEPERGGVVVRRVAAWQLSGPGTLRFRIRGSPSEPAAHGVELRANGVPVARIDVSGRFEEVDLALPDLRPAPDGTVTLIWRGDPEQTPELALGSTGATLRTDVLVDAQGTWVGVALDDHFVRRAFDAGALLLALEEEGRIVRSIRRFDLDERGLRELHGAVSRLPDGTVVALAMRAADDAVLDGSQLAATLALIGGAGPSLPAVFHRAALLGARGAPPESALQDYGGGRAVVRGGPFVEDYPRFVLDEVRLPSQQEPQVP